jgi:hypothetical protein
MHVYPWEMLMQVYVDQSTATDLGGTWLVDTSHQTMTTHDWRVSEPYPRGGLPGWVADTEQQLSGVGGWAPYKKLRIPEFFPAVDPAAVLWRTGSGSSLELQIQVAFKQLVSWREPEWKYPHGYETVVAGFKVTGLGSSNPPPPLGLYHKRMRLPIQPAYPSRERSRASRCSRARKHFTRPAREHWSAVPTSAEWEPLPSRNTATSSN